MRYLALVCLLLSAALMANPTAQETDAVRVAPQVYKVVFENERVRVLSFVTEPGQTWPLHSHPDSIAVSLTGYSVRNIIPGQAPTERHSKPGDVRWIQATSHSGENSGTTQMRGVIIELKEPRP